MVGSRKSSTSSIATSRPRQHARQHLRQLIALRNRQRPRRAPSIEPVAPQLPRRRTRHAEKTPAAIQQGWRMREASCRLREIGTKRPSSKHKSGAGALCRWCRCRPPRPAANCRKKATCTNKMQSSSVQLPIVRRKGAAALYKTVVKKEPHLSAAWNNLGVCYHQTKKYALAVESFQHSLSSKPDSATQISTQVALARAYAMNQEPDKAYTQLDAAIPMDTPRHMNWKPSPTWRRCEKKAGMLPSYNGHRKCISLSEEYTGPRIRLLDRRLDGLCDGHRKNCGLQQDRAGFGWVLDLGTLDLGRENTVHTAIA